MSAQESRASAYPEAPEGTITGRVLAELQEEPKEFPVTRRSHREHEEDSDEPHVDERWLVSYADMMTLLFGLFVMLYSMANKFESVQASVAKKFIGEGTLVPADVAERIALKEALSTAEQSLRDTESEKRALQERLDAVLAKSSGPAPSPVTIVMRWPTNDHDIDLIVTDPGGKRFDFKNRKHREHPGSFVLDTRRGPGAEVWQSERILPGIYTVTYIFYNQYGNQAPARISASILTTKGSYDLPEATIPFKKNAHVTYRFSAGQDGKVRILR